MANPHGEESRRFVRPNGGADDGDGGECAGHTSGAGDGGDANDDDDACANGGGRDEPGSRRVA